MLKAVREVEDLDAPWMGGVNTPVSRQEAWPRPRGERGMWEMITVLLYVSYT